jgi:hypothetical protein
LVVGLAVWFEAGRRRTLNGDLGRAQRKSHLWGGDLRQVASRKSDLVVTGISGLQVRPNHFLTLSFTNRRLGHFTETDSGVVNLSHFPFWLWEMGATGLEPVTPSVSSKGQLDPSETSKGLAETLPPVCTPVCTSEPKPEQADPLAPLAAALLGLSAADRARLAAMLLGQQTRHAEGTEGLP